MALRDVLMPWERQPQGVVPVAQDVSRGLDLLVNFGATSKNQVSLSEPTISSTPTLGVGELGRVLRVTTQGTTQAHYYPVTSRTTSDPLSLLLVCRNEIVDGNSRAYLQVASTTASSGTPYFFFYKAGANVQIYANGGYRITATNAAASVGTLVIGVTYDGATLAMSINGVEIGTYSSTTLGTNASTHLWIGNGFGGSALAEYAACFYWTRNVGRERMRQLTANWLDAFAPQQILVPVSAGGSSWSVSLAESASGTDTSTASFVVNASVSITESASGTDTPTAANVMARSITENASATDDQSETYSATGNASIVETASATDTLTAAATVVASLIENASAADILAAATIAVRAITESASATDTQSQTYSAAGTVSIVESANATDTITAAATLFQAITESASATDTATAATTMVRVITENGNATDLIVGFVPAILNASITELAAAYDTVAVFLPGVLGGSGNWVILVPRDDNAVLVALDEHLMAVAVQ